MAFNRSSQRQNVAIILSSMSFLLWGVKWVFPLNLEEEAHGFNKWQLGLLILNFAPATIYSDEQFGALFSQTGQPAEAPARLALVLVLQFAEGLSDRQAADAVRGRIDWKYALALELTDPGFDASVLSEFRTRLIQGGAEHLLLEPLLRRLEERALLKARGTQRTDSTHILAAIRTLNRLELVGETMRYALNRLAVAAPVWLRAHLQPAWGDRYSHRVENYRFPKADAERQQLAAPIGADGFALLQAAYAPAAPPPKSETPLRSRCCAASGFSSTMVGVP